MTKPGCRICGGPLPGRRTRYCETACWVAWQVLKVREPGYSVWKVLERIALYQQEGHR